MVLDRQPVDENSHLGAESNPINMYKKNFFIYHGIFPLRAVEIGP